MAIVDVTVIPMDSERRLARHTVLVDNGRITWIGPATDAEIPPGAVRVDGRGRFVMPGLADMHAHVADESSLAVYVAYGVTTIRDMWGKPRRDGNTVRIRRTEPLIGRSEEVFEVADAAVLGRASCALFASLGPRLQHLQVGETTELDLLGPGFPPDYGIAVTSVRVERGSEHDADERRYRFEARRANAEYCGVLSYDDAGLAQIEFLGRPIELSPGGALAPARILPHLLWCAAWETNQHSEERRKTHGDVQPYEQQRQPVDRRRAVRPEVVLRGHAGLPATAAPP